MYKEDSNPVNLPQAKAVLHSHWDPFFVTCCIVGGFFGKSMEMFPDENQKMIIMFL